MDIKPITQDEWQRFDWIPTENKTIFIQGVERTDPPNDGYHYIDVTTFADSKQQWARACKITNNGE